MTSKERTHIKVMAVIAIIKSISEGKTVTAIDQNGIDWSSSS